MNGDNKVKMELKFCGIALFWHDMSEGVGVGGGVDFLYSELGNIFRGKNPYDPNS